MKKINKLRIELIFFFIILFSGCQNERKYLSAEQIVFSDFGKPISLKGDNVIFDDILLKPIKIHLVDSVLIMKNRNTEYAYYIYNIENKKKVAECISFGIGPDEMIDPQLISSSGNNIWIYDKNRRILNVCDKQKFVGEGSLVINSKIEFKDFCNNMVLIPQKGFIASVFNKDKGRFGLFNQEGDTICYKGKYPKLSNLNTNLEQIEGFVNDMIVNIKGDRIFVSYKRTDLIEYYDSDMNLVRRLHGPEHFFPEIHQEGDRIRTNKGAERDAFSFPLAVGDRVFVLYSGKVFDPMKPDYLKDKILVFDWDGNPKQYFHLDIPIFDFIVDEKLKIIYGLTDTPESQIVQFKF